MKPVLRQLIVPMRFHSILIAVGVVNTIMPGLWSGSIREWTVVVPGLVYVVLKLSTAHNRLTPNVASRNPSSCRCFVGRLIRGCIFTSRWHEDISGTSWRAVVAHHRVVPPFQSQVPDDLFLSPGLVLSSSRLICPSHRRQHSATPEHVPNAMPMPASLPFLPKPRWKSLSLTIRL